MHVESAQMLFLQTNPWRDGKIRLNLTARFDRIAKIDQATRPSALISPASLIISHGPWEMEPNRKCIRESLLIGNSLSPS